MTKHRKPGRPSSGGIGSQGGMTGRVSFRLTDEQKAAIEALASTRGVSASQIYAEAIDRYLKEV